MSVEDKIIDDITYVIEYLLEVLRKRNEMSLILRNDYKTLQNYIYSLYNRLGSDFEMHLLDILDIIVNPHSTDYITKVLGKGSAKKLTIIAKAFSASAEEKIEKAGGKAKIAK